LGISAATSLRSQWQVPEAKPSTMVVGGSPSAKANASRSFFAPAHGARETRGESAGMVVFTRAGDVVRVHGSVHEEALASVLAAMSGC
jgi:hypothetical protein